MAEKPELTDEQYAVWMEYMRLSRSRRYEQGQPLPIPFEVIDAYCRRFGPHDTDEFERFLTLVEVMDSTYIERARQQQR